MTESVTGNNCEHLPSIFFVLGHNVFSYDSFQFTPTLSVPFCFTNSSVSLQTRAIFVSVPELCNVFDDLWEMTRGFDIPHQDGFFRILLTPGM